MVSAPVVGTESGSQTRYASLEISAYMILTLVQVRRGLHQKPEHQTTTEVPTEAAAHTCGLYENARPACGPETTGGGGIR